MLSQTVKLNDNGSAKVCGGNTELRFGYVKNENIYSVNFELSPEWEGLYIRVFWHVPEGDDPSSSLVVDGSVTVPPAVTAITGVGKITLEGTDGTKTITSSDVTYRVYENSGISDGTDPELGSSAWEQFVNEVKADADRAETSAAAAKQSEANAKASETASKLSETNSSASAAAAKQSEANAKASETEATKQAGIAFEKANSASASADVAKLSETEATKQAGIALQHANTSKENADSSSKNASLASASAAAAKQSETASATSEANSKTSENKSLEYMNAAKGYSESASSSAASSEASYQNALKSAQDAAGHASSALSSANESARILSEVKNTASTAQDELNAAKNNYLTELSDAKTSHISDMETKASELTEASKKDIESAKETALNEIAATNKKLPDITVEDAGKSLLVSEDGTGFVLGDPPVVSYTKEESDARYAPIESAIRPTANGNPAVCEDSIAWSFQGLKVYGKSTQDGTPSPENPAPIVSAGEGGSVELSVTGENLLASWRKHPDSNPEEPFTVDNNVQWVRTDLRVQSGATYFVGCVQDEVLTSANIYVNIGVASSSGVIDARSGKFVASKSGLLYIRVGNYGETHTYSAFIVSATPITVYTPYQAQPLALSTPSGLPGIQVDIGGNYTDASGQQLVCDVVDLGALKSVQNVMNVQLNGTEAVYKFPSIDDSWFYFQIESPKIQNAMLSSSESWYKVGLSNYFKIGNPYSTRGSVMCALEQGGKSIIRVGFEDLEKIADASDVQNWLKEKYDSGNPLVLLYQAATPITTPLSDEEIAAYRALTTYPGTTVVSTAEPVAGIEAKYVVDPQKYIEKYVDKKISEAVSEAVTSAIALM